MGKVDQKLNVDDLNKVDDFLRAKNQIDVIHLQGFLYAVILTPRLILPTEWLPILLGAEPLFSSKEQAKEMVGYFGRLAYQIKTSMEAAMPSLPLVSPVDALGDLAEQGDLDLVAHWGEGFMRALKIDKNYWLLSHDTTIIKCLQVIFSLVEADDALLKRLGKGASDLGALGLRQKSVVQLPAVVKKLHRHKRKFLDKHPELKQAANKGK